MPTNEHRFGVWLNLSRVGTLHQREDYTWFTFDEEYIEDPTRAVLGLAFEEDLNLRRASALRLPSWFSNLLPEGRLREWIARDRGVAVAREMELLAQVGRDLPGAVRVLEEDEPPDLLDPKLLDTDTKDPDGTEWRFSLAGVGLKFSMVQAGDRLTLPAHGEGGEWIVKLPDPTYADVPANEFAIMSLAAEVGITVPEFKLVGVPQLDGLPENLSWGEEATAYAIRRFDRPGDGKLTHIEDFAQVRNLYPDQKYAGTFETVASLVYRGVDLDSLQEFVRRLTLNVLVGNGDAHLKNWSLIYHDARTPQLSPAYDLVSTVHYRDGEPENLGLKFNRSRLFENVTFGAFERLEERLGVPSAGLAQIAAETVDRAVGAWPRCASVLDRSPHLQESIQQNIAARRISLGVGGIRAAR